MIRDESLREALDRVRSQAEALQAHGLIAEIDQTEATLRDERDRVLFGDDDA